MMPSKTRWCTVRSLAQCYRRRVHELYNVGEKATPLYCTLTSIAMQVYTKIEAKAYKEPAYNSVIMLYCVCVFFPFILDIKFVGRTSRGHTGFLIHLSSAVRALIFHARRIQPFLSLIDREVEFCVVQTI